MENNKSSLFGINKFAQAFDKHTEDTFYESIHEQVRNKPYYHKYIGFKNTILALSYLFNFASIITASYAIFWVSEWLTGNIWIAYLVSFVFLFFLEKMKRKSSNEVFQSHFFRNSIPMGWVCLSLFCLAISLSSSGFGTKEGVQTLSPDAELIAADSTANHYRQQVIQLEEENQKMSKQRDHTNTIYYRLQSVIKTNKEMIADYNTRILELDKKLEGKNDLLSNEYQEKVVTTAWILVSVTLLLEFLFECCIAYLWYFKFRVYVERKKNLIDKKPKVAQEQSNFLNGSTNRKKPQTRNPIGFHISHENKKTDPPQGLKEKTSVQTCTEHQGGGVEDIYTIEHEYTRNKKTIKTHYTLPQIEARIKQYFKSIDEAIHRKLGEEVIQNRMDWLKYWEGKKAELLLKIKKHNNVIT